MQAIETVQLEICELGKIMNSGNFPGNLRAVEKRFDRNLRPYKPTPGEKLIYSLSVELSLTPTQGRANSGTAPEDMARHVCGTVVGERISGVPARDRVCRCNGTTFSTLTADLALTRLILYKKKGISLEISRKSASNLVGTVSGNLRCHRKKPIESPS